MVEDQNAFLLCHSVMNDPDLSDCLGQVCLVPPESKLDVEKQDSVFMHHISGTNSQET